jgi:hypothetical protein
MSETHKFFQRKAEENYFLASEHLFSEFFQSVPFALEQIDDGKPVIKFLWISI